MTPRPSLRALIWDVDGTLAETEDQGHRPAFNAAFAEAGLPWHWDTAAYGALLEVTGGKERIAHWWHMVDAAAAGATGAAAQVRALHEAKTAHYLQAVRQGRVALRPGVARLMREARARGLRQAIATTTTAANVRELLAATLGAPEADTLFEVMGAGDIVARKKPAPDIYLWVLQRMGLSANEALALEDSAAGARAAMGAGLPCVVTRSTYTAHQAMPAGLLADLDGLGDTGDAGPARGHVLGRPWQGVVDTDGLARWHRDHPRG